MAIHKTKNGIRATGRDANSLFIAFMDDDALLEAFKEKRGSEDFQQMIREAMVARGFDPESIPS